MTENDELLNLRDAGALIGNGSRQSIYLAIVSGRLPAVKNENGFWRIRKQDVIRYHETKHSREFSWINGKLVFDLDKGEMSVTQVAKFTGNSIHRVYYMIRKGRLAAKRKGAAYVILKKDLDVAFGNEMKKKENPNQLKFA